MFASVIEARAWIKNAGQFAPTRFESREDALDFVYKLYRCGAVIVAVHDSRTLLIELPDDADFRGMVLTAVNYELEREGRPTLSDTGQDSIEMVFGDATG